MGRQQLYGQNEFMVSCVQSIICPEIKEHFVGKGQFLITCFAAVAIFHTCFKPSDLCFKLYYVCVVVFWVTSLSLSRRRLKFMMVCINFRGFLMQVWIKNGGSSLNPLYHSLSPGLSSSLYHKAFFVRSWKKFGFSCLKWQVIKWLIVRGRKQIPTFFFAE